MTVGVGDHEQRRVRDDAFQIIITLNTNHDQSKKTEEVTLEYLDMCFLRRQVGGKGRLSSENFRIIYQTACWLQ